MCTENNLEKTPPQSPNHVKRKNFASPDNCFLGSSLYYGGPDEHYVTPQAIKVDQDDKVNFHTNFNSFKN